MNWRHFYLTTGAVVLGLTLAHLQSGGVPLSAAPSGRSSVLLRGGTVRTVQPGVGTIKAGDVLIAGKRIAYVGPRLGRVPPGTQVVNCRGQVITPGFVESVSAAGLVAVGALKHGRDHNAGRDPVRAAFMARDGFNRHSPVPPIVRKEGVTSIIGVPTGGLVSGLSFWADLGSHSSSLPSIVRGRLAMHVTFGRGAARVLKGSRGLAPLRLRELLDDARYYAAHRRDYQTNRSRTLNASRIDLQALNRLLRKRYALVIAAQRRSDIAAALRVARQYKLRPIIVGGAQAFLMAGQLRRARATVILSPHLNLPHHMEQLGSRNDNALRLHRAGVRVVISTMDAYDFRHRSHMLRFAAGNAVRHGLPVHVALRAVTLNPARTFGLGRSHGSLHKGKLANIVVWSGDPFEIATRARRVYVHGRLMPLGRTRHDELHRRYR